MAGRRGWHHWPKPNHSLRDSEIVLTPPQCQNQSIGLSSRTGSTIPPSIWPPRSSGRFSGRRPKASLSKNMAALMPEFCLHTRPELIDLNLPCRCPTDRLGRFLTTPDCWPPTPDRRLAIRRVEFYRLQSPSLTVAVIRQWRSDFACIHSANRLVEKLKRLNNSKRPNRIRQKTTPIFAGS